ncbi:MAG: radical SAM protein [Pseudomonadota bacterium]
MLKFSPQTIPIKTIEEGGSAGRIDWDEFALALDQHAHACGADEPVSVYVHLPFCPSRCLNCDRNTVVTHSLAEIDQYLAALDQEMTLVTARLGNGRELQQLHLGGGTPNYLSETQIIRLMTIIERHFTITEHTETSLDVSPKRSSRAQLALLRGLGFRRINFEVRDLDDEVQKAIGRSQSMSVLSDVYDNARDFNFDALSMDLVYGLPQQTLSSMKRSVASILELAPDRLLCWSFSRQAGTFLHQRSLDPASLPSLGDKVAMFNAIADTMQEAGYSWIGLDCFSKQTDPLWSARRERLVRRNWIGYTAMEPDIVLGFGAGAISEMPGIVAQNHADISRWSDALWQDRLPIEDGCRISPEVAQQRALLSDLMCNMEVTGDVPADRDDAPEPLASLIERGYVEQPRAGHLVVTERGRFAMHQAWGNTSPVARWAAGF